MRKIFSLFAALTLSVGLWAENSVITFTSTSELYPMDIEEVKDFLRECVNNGSCENFEKWKEQYPKLSYITTETFYQLKSIAFKPNAFLDANDQVLTFTIDYDELTHAGTITINGELVKIADDVFYDCTALTSITLPEGVTSIGGAAFSGCALTSVILPESLSSIGIYGFYGCPLSSVTIPANVTYIRPSAFGGNSSLTDVYVAWTTTLPTLEDNNTFSFSSIGTATLHVPADSKALYQNADVWKGFASFEEYITPAIAIAAVNAKIDETDDDNVKAIATSAATAINAATTEAEVNTLKNLAIANIASAKAAYTAGETAGDAAGYQRAQDDLPTEGTTGPAVTITKGDKTVTFYNTDKVEYSIVDAD